MKKALFIAQRIHDIYSPKDQEVATELVDIYAPIMGPKEVLADKSILKDMQIMLTGWGAPKLDKQFLESAPNLEAVFYGAGTVRHILTDAFWDRDIVICSAWAANAIPVAEYTLAHVLLALKQTFQFAEYYRKNKNWGLSGKDVCGAFGGKVGIISLGMIGRKMVEHLQYLNIKVLAYDPFIAKDEAERLGIQLATMEEIFSSCNVVSLHAPLLDETRGMIRGSHLEMMQPHTTFINTARGGLVNEPEMVEVLKRRKDLQAVLDVTDPEPIPEDSDIWNLPNVFVTPHIAGSMGEECFRMGRIMIEELRRYLAGRPLRWPLARQQVKRMA